MVEAKALRRLPQPVRARVARLVRDIQSKGVYQPHWPHYGEIKRRRTYWAADERHFHCHILGFRWVACWRVRSGESPQIYYVGSHEGAPYNT